MKNGSNFELYFDQSSAQNSVCVAMTAVTEIVKDCSCVLGLLTTGKSDSCVTRAAVKF